MPLKFKVITKELAVFVFSYFDKLLILQKFCQKGQSAKKNQFNLKNHLKNVTNI